jgi:hypothetical protein
MSYLDQPLLPSRKQIQIIIQKTDPNHHQELMFQPDPNQRVSHSSSPFLQSASIIQNHKADFSNNLSKLCFVGLIEAD